ncbi:hypothetical protein [Niabella hibiscisoli]|uniref:hypothetical protein n=1 Tax=Niabella hibiscisoli TaxID=1825928 RepID=UPI001F1018C3|nr:hypothetical protein [Niabella hibiscisoli]MCH5716112.1 hypothetical protein [Niabella hibiscisoli]
MEKVAITDACIFIDLYELQLLTHFFEMELEVHTTINVMNELITEQRQQLQVYHSVKKLTIHIAGEVDQKIIRLNNYPRSLSESDCSVLYFAEKHNAILLSSDKVVRNTAKRRSIDYHGMLWIFDRLVAAGMLNRREAGNKLQQLIRSNIVFQNNRELVAEMEKRLGVGRWLII